MKEKLTDELSSLLAQSKEWVRLEIEYAKLTAAEKFTVLMSSLIIGAICLMLGMVAIILFSFSLVHLFASFMSVTLAFLSIGGVVILLALIIWWARDPIILTPLAKFITRLILDKKS